MGLDLKERLDALYASFNHVDSATDPIQIVRRYEQPADREVVGFCAAALAFGRVASVLQSIERLVAIMGPSPAGFVRGFEPARQRAALEPLVHRWTRGRDLVALIIILQRMLERGSIEEFFLDGCDPAMVDVSHALESFSIVRSRSIAGVWHPAKPPVRGVFLSRRRSELQAPEPVSAMDGAERHRRFWPGGRYPPP